MTEAAGERSMRVGQLALARVLRRNQLPGENEKNALDAGRHRSSARAP